MKFLDLFFYQPFLGVNIAQFFDTLCNNFIRNAITAAVIFGIIDVENNVAVSSLMVGILMLPSFLFMATAGEIVDKYPKDAVIKILKFLQLFAAVLTCIGFLSHNIWILLISLFFMGTFAAFLSTAKYSILPDILPQSNLLAANGLMQMMVFLAILGGTILGGIIFSFEPYLLYAILIIASILGFVFALIIPCQTKCSSDITINKNLIKAIIKNLSFTMSHRSIIFYICAISWFWFVGTVMISIIPTFTKVIVNGNNAIFTLFIVLFTVGLSLGTISCQAISKGKVSDKFILPCLILIIVSLLDLAFASVNYVPENDTIALKSFLTQWQGIHIILGMLTFSFAGGIYIVPLTTMLQILSPDNSRAKIIASNNIINALFMIIGSGLCTLLLLLKAQVAIIFIILALLNCIVFIAYLLLNNEKNIKNNHSGIN